MKNVEQSGKLKNTVAKEFWVWYDLYHGIIMRKAAVTLA